MAPWRRVRAIPLGCTLLTTLLLLVVPSLFLQRLPRQQAVGLERLLANVSLLQSFRANPDRPVPEVWKQRLGEEAAVRLWRLQTRTWWQFWDGHQDGKPYLALSSRSIPPSLLQSLGAPALRVENLLIFPPDPQSLQIFRDQLRPQVRRSAGLRLRCLPRLEGDQAVFWRPSGLGVLLGPLAPFLQDFQEGCLSLTIQGDALLWGGEAASVEGMVLPIQGGGNGPPEVPVRIPPGGDVLLEVQGPSLEQLLSGLLAREMIRQPLAERYGMGPEQINLLRQTPFRLLLRPRAQGPYQATIELVVAVERNSHRWQRILSQLSRSLEKQNLRLASGNPPSLVLWQRKDDGVVVGGWQWTKGADQLSFFLGPQPFPPATYRVPLKEQRQNIVLLARPVELEARGLLPPDLPEVVKRSRWLSMSAEPYPGMGKGSPISQLKGSLVLQP